jgi:Transmembrane amino acid transporter protein
MSQRTFLAIGSWVLITLTFWILAWIIAESIPNFNNLLALISSLFASWFTYGLAGVFWLYMNWGQLRKKKILTIINCLIVLMGAGIMVMGLYASSIAIKEEGSQGSGSWTCADNSKSKS